MKKVCCRCERNKVLEEYNNSSRSIDGKRSECRDCQRLESKGYYEKNKRNKEYLKKTKEQKKKYYKTEKAKELKRKTDKRYREKNRESILERRRERSKDPYLVLTERVRGRFRKIIRRNIIDCKESKTKRSKELLGCSIEFYKDYLEEQFSDGMSWDNYGEWHIDHIKPICLFNLEDEKELFEAFNYKNTQPLWAKDNLSKGAKYEIKIDNKETP